MAWFFLLQESVRQLIYPHDSRVCPLQFVRTLILHFGLLHRVQAGRLGAFYFTTSGDMVSVNVRV